MFMDHIVLNAEDVDLLMSFYSQVIGLKPERLEQYHDGTVPFPSLRINEDTIVDIFPMEMWVKEGDLPKGRPNLNHFCLALQQNQWQALYDEVARKGVTITNGPVKVWGSHGYGTSFYFTDPEGNLIEAKYYEAEWI